MSAAVSVAAVAPVADVALLGIDVEKRAPLSEGVRGLVAGADEIAALPALPGTPFDTALFSAKESVYKAVYARVRRFVGFEEARIAFAPEPDGTSGRLVATLAARLAAEAGVDRLEGRFAILPAHVATMVTLPTRAAEEGEATAD